MNAKQRRKQEKRQGLVKLGRMATVEIAAAQADREAALALVNAKDQALRDGMNNATTLAEAKAFAERALSDLNAQLAKTVAHLNAQHAENMEAQRHAHAAELADAAERIRVAEEKVEAMRAEIEEPAKLRKRLHEKQLENDRLTRELNLALQKPVEAQPIVILSAQAVKHIEAQRRAEATSYSVDGAE